MLQLGGMLSKPMQSKCILDGSQGANPLVDQQFSQLLEKITILTSFGSHFQRFQGHWKEQRF